MFSNFIDKRNQRPLDHTKIQLRQRVVDSVNSTYTPISTMTPGGGVNITMVTYNGIAHIGLVCCASKIDSLEQMSLYFQEAFDMLEGCVDDPSLNVDDIGETLLEEFNTIVESDLNAF